MINVDATTLGFLDGAVVSSLANSGSAGDFTTLIGQVEVTSHPANDNAGALVQGLSFNSDKMISANPLSSTNLTGNQPYTAMAWVYNPDFGNEEAIVSWGHRGGPNGSNSGMHQGTHPTFGAVGHWGGGAIGDPNQPDVGWGPSGAGTDINATIGQWAHLSYVWDGTEERVFIDGELSNSEVHIPLNPHLSFQDGSPTPFALGSESDPANVNSTPIAFSGTIAKVLVENVARSAEEVRSAFTAERSLFFDGFLDVSDLDSDGILDAIEDQYDCLDKNVADADADPDGDSLSNTAELGLGTDPCNPDSDGDGLNDGNETDLGSNPNLADTDGDGFDDYAEWLAGSSLLDANDFPNQAPVSLQLNNNSIAENLPFGSPVGAFIVTDPNPGASHSILLVEGNGSTHNSLFLIDSNGTLRTSVPLDFEENASLSIRARATDEQNASIEGNFTIS
ncbi:MAG TPA: hypothetical protein DIV54_02720, partial [Verrucomicrobiales bacterium]|nr:hypothetical protein [Verrucomicrobiales bacterium]